MSNTTATLPPGHPTLPQLEAAARHWCFLSNQNPDDPIKHKPVPGVNGPIDSTPRWQLIGNILLEQWRVQEALKVGLSISLDAAPQSA